MGIVDDDIARVREATDIAAVVGEHVGLKRVGRRLVGLCPFHSEKTPSFSVNPELGLYHCFGCQASGDAITFLREVEHLDFVEAVERLAGRAGIELRYDDRRAGEKRERRHRLVEAVAAAVDFYHRRLLEGDDARAARRYLRGRGFDGDAVRRFSVGWAPGGWDELSRHLQGLKFSREDLTEAGLAFVNRRNRLQDQFRARVMFPIFDVGGDPIAFGGRALEGDAAGDADGDAADAAGGGRREPKYKNSPEGAVYHKSRVLYALNWAKADVVAAGEVVVCEGYTDVMACHLAGAPRAVATCGTALTEDHVRLLKRFASRVVLAYDADAAGQAAAERFYEWEAKYDLQVAVAALEPGRDPADVWRDDPALLVKAVEEARPFLQFRVDRLLDRADRSTAEGRARAANGAIALVAGHPDPLVRDQYVVAVADRLEIDVGRFREAVERVRRRGGPTVDEEPPPDEGGPARTDPTGGVGRREAEVVRLAVHHPEHVPAWLSPVSFASPVAAAAFEALASASTFGEALERASGDGRRLLERVAVEEVVADDLAAYAEEVMVNLLSDVAERAAAAQSRGDDDRAMGGNRLLAELRQARSDDDRQAVRRLAGQLVTWVDAGREG